jgi:RNA polymerase sigma-70 factor (ECF subfamily)
MGGSTAAAEDIVQEVFLALLREQCGFDPERGTLSGYLFGIARKLVLRNLERGRSSVSLESETDEAGPRELAVVDDPLAGLTRHETIEALRRAVQALPRRYREVVVLCDLEELDYADAAVALGCPIGTVRSRMHRARALLLEKLHQDRKPKLAVDAWKPMRYAI